MFAKIFSSIFDSSIADDWQLRIVFQDLLVLADKDGVVDMTPQAIARRTNVPLDIVKERLCKLEAPDMTSRTPDHEGRRIIRLDPHRDWGWKIVNYAKYRESASKEMLRMSEADRKRTYRARHGRTPSPTPPTKYRDTDKRGEKQTCPAHVPDSPGRVPDSEPVRSPDSQSLTETISRERERREWSDELRAVNDELKGRTPADATGPKAQKRIEALIARQSELRMKLGRVA